MTLLNVSATLGIVTTKIGSRAGESAGCLCCGVICISGMLRGTEFCLGDGWQSRPSPVILGKSFCALLRHSSRVFPHKIDSGNRITTFWVSCLHLIAAPTEVKVLPRPILPATSDPGISESQTPLLTMNNMAETWCARNFMLGWPGIKSLWPGTRSSV